MRISDWSSDVCSSDLVEIEEFLRKAVEVVNRAWLWHSGDRRRAEEPVGRDHQPRPRPRQRRAQPPPRAGIAVHFQGVHRTAVAEEEGGHSCHGKKVASAVERDKETRRKDRDGHHTPVAKRWRAPRRTVDLWDLSPVIHACQRSGTPKAAP